MNAAVSNSNRIINEKQSEIDKLNIIIEKLNEEIAQIRSLSSNKMSDMEGVILSKSKYLF